MFECYGFFLLVFVCEVGFFNGHSGLLVVFFLNGHSINFTTFFFFVFRVPFSPSVTTVPTVHGSGTAVAGIKMSGCLHTGHSSHTLQPAPAQSVRGSCSSCTIKI